MRAAFGAGSRGGGGAGRRRGEPPPPPPLDFRNFEKIFLVIFYSAPS